MPSLTEITKDSLGITGFQIGKERIEKRTPFEGPRTARIMGACSTMVQVLAPLHHRGFEHWVNKRHSGLYPLIGVLADVGAYGAILGLIGLNNNQEAMQVFVGGKVIYNAWASFGGRIVDSVLKQKDKT